MISALQALLEIRQLSHVIVTDVNGSTLALAWLRLNSLGFTFWVSALDWMRLCRPWKESIMQTHAFFLLFFFSGYKRTF